MFSKLRTRFGIPGVISVIALVFAMFGGAYAASNSAPNGKATASAKAKKGPRGPKGATGPAGPAGPAGAKGDKGDAGANGSNGSAGADGKSVTGTPIAAGGACGAGVTGVKYTLNTTSTNVCNGKDGQTGYTETLPPGKTETGTWTAGFSTDPVSISAVSLSFNIPLATGVTPTLNYLDKTGTATTGSAANCPGSAEEPKAYPGNLCVYTSGNPEVTDGLALFEFRPQTLTPAGVMGIALLTVTPPSASAVGTGSWAVTAPTS